MLGLLRRLRGQAAGGAAAHLAARRAHRGADGRQRDPGRPAAEDRRVRPAALRRAALPARPPRAFAPVAMALGVVGILYGAVLAFAQTDLKRLVAYTSVSHMGFVLLGIFAWNRAGAAGRGDADDLPRPQHRARSSCWSGIARRSGCARATCGAWAACGRRCRAWAALAMFFALASLGLPGLGNFVGEFLVLLGRLRGAASAVAVAGGGRACLSPRSTRCWMMQRAFHGPARDDWRSADLGRARWPTLAADGGRDPLARARPAARAQHRRAGARRACSRRVAWRLDAAMDSAGRGGR